jgi:hypothetical protein
MVQKTQASKLRGLIKHQIHWDILTEYLAVEKQRIVTLLTTCTPDQLGQLQGELKAVNKLLSMSDNLKAEERA